MTLINCSSSPEIDVEILLGYSLGQSRAWLLTYQDEELDQEDYDRFMQILNRRKQGEPIAYILGQKEFWSLNLMVNKSTLIPRPETEIVVETALEIAASKVDIGVLSIADLGTGSGAIALAIASEYENSFITAVDASLDAIDVAKKNANQLELANIEFVQSNWFESLTDHQFDIICSNPPYIEAQDPHLQQGDLRFEPQSALASGVDGFFDIQHIISHASAYLRPEGWLVLEHGFQQSKRTQALLEQQGFININTREDYAGHPRVTYGQLL